MGPSIGRLRRRPTSPRLPDPPQKGRDMEIRAHYVAVGAFVLLMVVLGFASVLWLARGTLTTQFTKYDIYFAGPVSGLREGSVVEYNGVPVGKVLEVRIDPANVERIRVNIEIDSKVVIKADAKGNVETNLLSGVAYIQIAGGTQDAPVLTAGEGERYPVIASRRSRLANVYARVPQLLEKLNEVADNVNDLLGDKNRQAISETLENVRAFSGNLSARDKDIAELAGNANTAMLSLTKLLDNVDRTYSSQDGIADRLSGGLGDFDKLAKNLIDTNRQLQGAVQDLRPGIRTLSQQTLVDVGSLVAEARQFVSGLSRLTAGLERDPSRILFGDRHEGYRPQ
jgi:phospholipid/cholesterol/gamma-HCH transport system substrate-binding protein